MAEFKHIVRIMNADLKGELSIAHALTKVKGVGFSFANAICTVSGVSRDKKTGELTDLEVKTIDDVVQHPAKHGIPSWMFNRRHDYESGGDRHIVGTDQAFVQSNDIRRLKRIKSYRGIRHAQGLPVRGQRTRSNFRRNKGKVQGVRRKSAAQ